MSDYSEIDVDALAAALDRDATLVDVREAEEYAEGHVGGAVFVPLSELEQRVGDLPDGALLLICRSGARSGRACEFLAAQGRTVTNIAGGTLAWIESGRPVVTGMDRG